MNSERTSRLVEALSDFFKRIL
ncbi:hypothetical protein OL548_21155 [Lysinibacillus sp. MHQ-1]|nr:hypothetical protein OL548_21155 [Lysinibacillus sp. MHQ-1]